MEKGEDVVARAEERTLNLHSRRDRGGAGQRGPWRILLLRIRGDAVDWEAAPCGSEQDASLGDLPSDECGGRVLPLSCFCLLPHSSTQIPGESEQARGRMLFFLAGQLGIPP
eukprot:89455-Hanusia_phi.AAC.1